jgi:D-alanine-D-alanine ligase
MTPTSLAPEQAAHCGISFDALCDWLVEDASCAR